MKKLITLLAFFVGFNANAGLLSVSLSNANVAIGGTVEVSIFATDFDPLNFLWFDLEYDTDLFTFNSSSLSGILLDNSDFSYTVDEYDYGLSVAWDNNTEIAGGDFLAAKFNLVAKAIGSTNFDLTNVFAIVDADVDPQQGSASATVNAAVPAPATVGLFTLALFGIVGLRRKA